MRVHLDGWGLWFISNPPADVPLPLPKPRLQVLIRGTDAKVSGLNPEWLC